MRLTPTKLLVLLSLAVVGSSGGLTPHAAADAEAPSSARTNSERIVAAREAIEARSSSATTRAESFAIAGRTPTRTEAAGQFLDPIGDVPFAPGDVTVVIVDAHSSGLIEMVVGVSVYESPLSANWQIGATGPVWDIDRNLDGVLDFYAVMANVGGTVGAAVFDAADRFVCTAQVGLSSVNRMYGVRFPASCVGNPQSILFSAAIVYDDVSNTGLQSVDLVPDDGGWIGPLANDAFVTTPPPVPSGVFQSLDPARLVESRFGQSTVDGQFNGIGTRSAGSITQFVVAGRGGVPSTASAVVLNVTAIEARSAGYFTVFPCGSAQPNASSVNFAAGQTVANAVIAKVGVAGTVCLFSPSVVDLVVDVNGSFSDGPVYSSLNPSRLAETRPGLSTVDGQFNGIGTRPAGNTLELTVTGRGGVPADASAVVLNVTAVDARGAGYITVFPCGSSQPNASSVNFAAGQTVANAVIARVGIGGRVCIFSQMASDLVVDVNGFFGVASSFASVVPARLLETRAGLATVDGQFNGIGVRGAGVVTELVVAGRGGVPINASTVVLNVTVTGAQAAGFVTVFPCGSARPNASNLNYTAGQSIPNAVVSKVGTSGRVCIFTLTATDLIVDVNGYFV